MTAFRCLEIPEKKLRVRDETEPLKMFLGHNF